MVRPATTAIAATVDRAMMAPTKTDNGSPLLAARLAVASWVRSPHSARNTTRKARWATANERVAVITLWLVGTVVVHQAFVWLWGLAPNPFWTPEWWFFWCDAWIFVGSIAATYAMARGWNEFWLAWIGVDLIGVPFGFATGYVPTAVLYFVYGLFVVYGFTQWVKASRTEHRDVEPTLAGAGAQAR